MASDSWVTNREGRYKPDINGHEHFSWCPFEKIKFNQTLSHQNRRENHTICVKQQYQTKELVPCSVKSSTSNLPPKLPDSGSEPFLLGETAKWSLSMALTAWPSMCSNCTARLTATLRNEDVAWFQILEKIQNLPSVGASGDNWFNWFWLTPINPTC